LVSIGGGEDSVEGGAVERRLIVFLDAGCANYRPPFGSLGLMISRQRFWILLIAREYQHAEFIEP